MAASIIKTIMDNPLGLTDQRVFQATINYDTADEEFDIVAAVVGLRYYVLAINYGVTAAHNIKFYSGGTASLIFNFDGAMAQKDGLAQGAIFQTGQGEKLGFSSSTTGTFTVTYTSSARLAYGLGI